MRNQNRNYGDNTEIEGSEKGNPVENILNELAGRLARTETGDISAVLFKIVCNFNRVELYR